VYMRVVRFTGVSADRMNQLRSRVQESGGPPEGVPSSGLQIVYDESQGTAVVLQLFNSEEDMRTGAEVLSAMDPADTPGTRDSVDAGEVVADLSAAP
jgi:hypothetical protein